MKQQIDEFSRYLQNVKQASVNTQSELMRMT